MLKPPKITIEVEYHPRWDRFTLLYKVVDPEYYHAIRITDENDNLIRDFYGRQFTEILENQTRDIFRRFYGKEGDMLSEDYTPMCIPLAARNPIPLGLYVPYTKRA